MQKVIDYEEVYQQTGKRGFRNEIFQTLDKVIDRLCSTIRSLSPGTIKNITGRNWICRLNI